MDKSEAIYQLRCAFIHEISLHSTSKRSSQKGTHYKFNLNGDPASNFDNGKSPIVKKTSKTSDAASPKRLVYVVNFWGNEATIPSDYLRAAKDL